MKSLKMDVGIRTGSFWKISTSCSVVWFWNYPLKAWLIRKRNCYCNTFQKARKTFENTVTLASLFLAKSTIKLLHFCCRTKRQRTIQQGLSDECWLWLGLILRLYNFIIICCIPFIIYKSWCNSVRNPSYDFINSRFGSFKCYIFHDVDLLPEHFDNKYG